MRFRSLRHSFPLLLIGLLAAALLAGCSGRSERDMRSGADVLYERGNQAMESGNYTNAIRWYEVLTARYPFANQTKQAQLDLIYSYYRNRQFEMAVDAATQFERENPTHPRVDYALYMRGLSYFSGEHSWYHRLFNVDLAARPPRNVQESFSVFGQLVQRFPDSRYAADARRRMVFQRNRLATYENGVAHYYMKRGAWMAALNRARYAVEQYEGAPGTPEALAIMAEAYERLGMREQALDTRRVLEASYPHHAAEAEQSVEAPWWRFW